MTDEEFQMAMQLIPRKKRKDKIMAKETVQAGNPDVSSAPTSTKKGKPAGRLSAYGTIDGLAKRLDDIAGVEVTILELEWKTGDWGEYVLIKVTDENGELMTVATSGFLVRDALHDAEDKQALPLVATFTKSGRTWVFE